LSKGESTNSTKGSGATSLSDQNASKTAGLSEIEDQLYIAPRIDKEFAAYLSGADKPRWPVTRLQLANAGPLGEPMRDYLDDMEPLVGLIADELGSSQDRFDDARNLIMSFGFLQTVFCFTTSAYNLHHQWSLEDHTAQRQLRVGWLEDGKGQIYDKVGWGYNDSYVDALQSQEPYDRFVKLSQLIAGIYQKYPSVPARQLRESGLAKLVTGVANLIGISPRKLMKAMEMDKFVEIHDWPSFLKTYQGDTGRDVKDSLLETLPMLEQGFSAEKKFYGKLHLLKGFASSFRPPYTIEDKELWKFIAAETYEKVQSAEFGKKLINNLYHSPFEPEYGTEVPNYEVFDEIVTDFNKYLSIKFDDSAEGVDFYQALINFEFTIASRNHYISESFRSDLQSQWDKYYEVINELLKAELTNKAALADGSFMNEIDGLIGLEPVKAKLRNLAKLAMSDTGKKEIPPAGHIIFTGNPGTGKTTVAEMLGKIYAALGLLSQGHVISVQRADLVAEYTGQTAPKVADAVTKALGGILFIDEAYTLKRDINGSSDGYGQEAIDALLTHMEDKRGQFVVIAAGYPAEMSTFVDSNPGLKSRFNDRWQFDDYSDDELFTIFESFADNATLNLGNDVEKAFKKLSSEAKKAKNFSNARWAREVFEESRVRRALRSENNPGALLEASDLSETAEVRAVSQDTISNIEAKLDLLVGLKAVKEEVKSLIAFQNLQVRRQAQGLPVIGNSNGHMVFAGPPGTGKTTVARLIGQIYKEMGLLKSGQVVEVSRADLVAGFIGQTAIKTEAIVNKADGGVLFIDEAYTLVSSPESDTKDFGKESIDTLLKLMEDRKGRFVVIAAGYEQNMQEFLKANPGLESRFGTTLHFEKWSTKEIKLDVQSQLEGHMLKLKSDAITALETALDHLVDWDKFASGRTSRTFVERIIEAQARRLAGDLQGDLTEVTAADIENAASRTIA
jgi:SpoVK/Ycf46/Vps4 family AAA+-type ATPase